MTNFIFKTCIDLKHNNYTDLNKNYFSQLVGGVRRTKLGGDDGLLVLALKDAWGDRKGSRSLNLIPCIIVLHVNMFIYRIVWLLKYYINYCGLMVDKRSVKSPPTHTTHQRCLKVTVR